MVTLSQEIHLGDGKYVTEIFSVDNLREIVEAWAEHCYRVELYDLKLLSLEIQALSFKRSRLVIFNMAATQTSLILELKNPWKDNKAEEMECLRIMPCSAWQALPSRPVVVASAMGKTTNALLHAANLALETGEVDVSAIRTAGLEECSRNLKFFT